MYTSFVRCTAPFFPDLLWRGGHDRRVLHLTIDDSPTQKTSRYLQIFEQFHIPVTFFAIGKNVLEMPERLREIVDRGHEIGNHSFLHKSAWTMTPQEIRDDLQRTTDAIENTIQQSVRFYRPPYGRFNRVARNWCAENAQQIMMMDVFPPDFKETHFKETHHAKLETHILDKARNGSIIVLHDNPKAHSITPQLLENVIPKLQDRGFVFDLL